MQQIRFPISQLLVLVTFIRHALTQNAVIAVEIRIYPFNVMRAFRWILQLVSKLALTQTAAIAVEIQAYVLNLMKAFG
jgi:hypothetical protein